MCLTQSRHKAAKCQNVMQMERVTIRLPKQQVDMLEKLVSAGEFPTISEAVRYAVREFVERHASRVIKESDQVSFNV